MSDNKKVVSEFEDIRKQYNKDLQDLRDKYEPMFNKVLEEVKNESSSEKAD